MSTIRFSKYHGTGNDFVMIDNLSGTIHLDKNHIQALCDRRFGVGADGLILINKSAKSDFYVDYYNADGSQSFCGNGARCAIGFAHELGLISNETTFEAIDGIHEGIYVSDENIQLKMLAPKNYNTVGENYFIDTGSPHFVAFCDDLKTQDIVQFGREIRYSEPYKKHGVNVNLAQLHNGVIEMLTYERGVEDETYSCGTGAVAVALVYAKINSVNAGEITVKVKGGELKVAWKSNESLFDNVELIGPAKRVFEGEINI